MSGIIADKINKMMADIKTVAEIVDPADVKMSYLKNKDLSVTMTFKIRPLPPKEGDL